MTNEEYRDILNKSERFYNEYKDPGKWKYTIGEYYKISDGLVADLILITLDVPSSLVLSKTKYYIEAIAEMKTKYLVYWIDKTIDDVKKSEKRENKMRDEFKNFETKSITTFSIVLTMLSFILSTANGIANSFSAIDILEIAIIYGFSISLFSGIIVLFSASNSEKIKKGIAFILIAILLILVFMLIKGNLYG